MHSTRARWGLRAQVAASVLALAACAAATSQTTPFGGETGEEAVVLTVENRNVEDMIIYVLTEGAHTRIGTAMSMTTSTYPIPAVLRATGAIRLYAHPLGSDRGFTSQRMLVPPGAQVQLRLARDLRLSEFAVW